MGLFTSFDISATGMTAQRLRSDIIAQNLANVNSTNTSDGGAYRRKTVVFTTKDYTPFSEVMGTAASRYHGGVKVSRIVEDYETPITDMSLGCTPQASVCG